MVKSHRNLITEKQQPPQGPFWHWKPRSSWTDDERLRYMATQFTLRPDCERAVLVLRYLPGIWDRMFTDRQEEVKAYALQRVAKTQLGEWQPPAADPAVLEELRAAAAIVEGERPPHIPTIEAECRAAFRAAVHGDEWRAVRGAFAEWQHALRAAVAAHGPLSEAHATLGLPPRAVPALTLPRFTDELDRAMSSPIRHPEPMLPLEPIDG